MKVPFSTLKKDAKAALRGHWGNAIGILVIYLLILCAVSGIIMIFYPFAEVMELGMSGEADPLQAMQIFSSMSGMWLVSILLSIFFLAPLAGGYLKVWLDRSRGLDTKISTLFFIFSKKYTAYLKTYLWMLLFTYLWSLALSAAVGICIAIAVAIPALGILLMLGALLGYALIILRYTLTFYIFLDNPELRWRATLNESKRMMAGNLWRYIGLSLSFIGWLLLCLLIIPSLWIEPYMSTTMANFYRSLKGEYDQQPQQTENPQLDY